MNARAGDIPAPLHRMRLRHREAAEGARPATASHVAWPNPRSSLPLVRGLQGAQALTRKPPVPGGGVKLRVHRDLTAGHVAARDRRTGIVEQNLGGHAAKSREGALRSPEPVLWAPAGKGPHIDAAGTARRRHEEPDLSLRATGPDPPLPEAGLQPPTRPRPETHRRTVARPATPGADAPPPVRPCAGSPGRPSRRQAHGGPHRRCPHGDGTVPRPMPPGHPTPSIAEAVTALRHAPPPSTIAVPSPASIEGLRHNPARSPSRRLQPRHGRNITRLLHLSPPQTLGPAAASRLFDRSSRLGSQLIEQAGSRCRHRASLSCRMTRAQGGPVGVHEPAVQA